MSVVISDSSPLICLCFLRREALLHQLFGQLLVPPTVVAELANPHPPVGRISIESIQGVEVRAPKQRGTVDQLLVELDPGERDAIALAIETNAQALLIDEALGRRVAKSLDIPIIGTCGILVRAKERGFIESVQPLIDSLRSDLRFFISDAIYEETLRLAGERIK